MSTVRNVRRKKLHKLRKRVNGHIRNRAKRTSRKSVHQPRISAQPARTRAVRLVAHSRAVRVMAPLRLATRSSRSAVANTPAVDFSFKLAARRREKRTRDKATAEMSARALRQRSARWSAARTRRCADLLAQWIRTTQARKLTTARTTLAARRHALAYAYAGHYGKRILRECVGVSSASRSYCALLLTLKQQRQRERASLLRNRMRATRARRQLATERSRAERARKLRARKRSRKRRRLTVARRTSTELKMTAAKRFAVMMWGPAALNEPEYSQSWP